jgi:hypothetical protein
MKINYAKGPNEAYKNNLKDPTYFTLIHVYFSSNFYFRKQESLKVEKRKLMENILGKLSSMTMRKN